LRRAHVQKRRKSSGTRGLWWRSFVVGVIASSILRKSPRSKGSYPRPTGVLSLCTQLVGPTGFRKTGRDHRSSLCCAVITQCKMQTCRGPARGNPPAGGPLLVPEQPLQALPVPDRHTPVSTTSPARCQAEFLDTWPSSARFSRQGDAVAFRRQPAKLRGEKRLAKAAHGERTDKIGDTLPLGKSRISPFFLVVL